MLIWTEFNIEKKKIARFITIFYLVTSIVYCQTSDNSNYKKSLANQTTGNYSQTTVNNHINWLKKELPGGRQKFDSHLKDTFNSKQQALIITTDKVIEGHIYPKRDHDFYQIKLPAPGILRIRHSSIDSYMASAIKIHNEIATEKRWVNGGKGKAQLIEHGIKKAGIFYIEIADTKDNNYSEKPYLLEVTFQEAADLAEPNDTLLRATPVNLPVTFTGKIFPPDDIDRFRFQVPEKGCLRVILTGVNPEAGSQIKLSDHYGKKVTGEGSSIFSPRAGGWIKVEKSGFQKLLLNVNDPGTYILSLKQLTSFINPADYRIRIEYYKNSLDKYEPNDKVLKASRIYAGEIIEGYILPAKDHDYYKIKLNGFGRLYVGISKHSNSLQPSINILGTNKRTSLTNGWINSNNKEFETVSNEEQQTKPDITSKGTRPDVISKGTYQTSGVRKNKAQITDNIPVNNPNSDIETHFVEVEIKHWGEYTIIVGGIDKGNASIEPYRLHCIFVNKQKGVPQHPSGVIGY